MTSGDKCHISPGERVSVLPGRQFQDFAEGSTGLVVTVDHEAGICNVIFDGRSEPLPVAARHLAPCPVRSPSEDTLGPPSDAHDLQCNFTNGEYQSQSQTLYGSRGTLSTAKQAAETLAESITAKSGATSTSGAVVARKVQEDGPGFSFGEKFELHTQMSSMQASIDGLRELVLCESEQRVSSCQNLERRLASMKTEACQNLERRLASMKTECQIYMDSERQLISRKQPEMPTSVKLEDVQYERLHQNFQSLDERILRIEKLMESLRVECQTNSNDSLTRLDERMGLMSDRLKSLAQMQTQTTEASHRRLARVELGQAADSERAAQHELLSQQHADLRAELLKLAASDSERVGQHELLSQQLADLRTELLRLAELQKNVSAGPGQVVLGSAELSSKVDDLIASRIKFESHSNVRFNAIQQDVYGKINATQTEITMKIMKLVDDQRKIKADVEHLKDSALRPLSPESVSPRAPLRAPSRIRSQPSSCSPSRIGSAVAPPICGEIQQQLTCGGFPDASMGVLVPPPRPPPRQSRNQAYLLKVCEDPLQNLGYTAGLSLMESPTTMLPGSGNMG